MEYQSQIQLRQLIIIIIVFVAAAAFLGALLGYILWGPGAANYSVMSQSNEATRTATVGSFSVTFPSVIVCKAGEISTRNIVINNLDDVPRYATVNLNLVQSGGVDSITISTLTGSPYDVTLAGYGSVTDELSLKPSAQGYAIFDVRVNGELLGSIALYVVS
jgi:hypothetical protein